MKHKTSFNYKLYSIKLFILLLVFFSVFIFSISIGSTEIGFTSVYNYLTNNNLSDETIFIIKDIRLVRVLIASIIGAILALAGMLLQGIFRNPLVDPFIVGISGGASLGAGIAILIGLNISFMGISSLPITSFLFALLSMLLTYRISLINGRIFIDRLLLGGVAISSLSSAILSFLLVIKGQDANAVLAWIMGSLAGKTWDSLNIIVPYSLVSLIFVLFNIHKLNIIQSGDDFAENLGLDTDKVKINFILIASVLSATVVSISGIIGFIGLIVPQVSRFFIKSSDYRLLLPVVLLIGAILLTLSDTLARVVLAPQELPVGIFTSMLGVPFFLFLLRNQKE